MSKAAVKAKVVNNGETGDGKKPNAAEAAAAEAATKAKAAAEAAAKKKATDDAAAKAAAAKKKKDEEAAAAAAAAGDGDEGEGEEGAGDDGEAGAGDDEGAGGDDGADGDQDWRAAMAGGDTDLLKSLQRYTSPEAVGKALKEAQKAARAKAAPVAPPPADAPVEEKAKYYTEHFGRPAKIDDVTIDPKLPAGEELEEPETQLLQTVAGEMYNSGVFGADQLQTGAEIVARMVVGGRKELKKRAAAQAVKTREILEDKWGKADVDSNLELANSYAAMRCEQAGVDPQALANLRLQDGTRLGDDPLWAQVMALGGRDFREDPQMLRPEKDGGAGGLDALQKELATEMAKMNSKDKKVQKEYASPEATAKRKRLREQIKRFGGSTTGKTGKGAAKK